MRHLPAELTPQHFPRSEPGTGGWEGEPHQSSGRGPHEDLALSILLGPGMIPGALAGPCRGGVQEGARPPAQQSLAGAGAAARGRRLLPCARPRLQCRTAWEVELGWASSPVALGGCPWPAASATNSAGTQRRRRRHPLRSDHHGRLPASFVDRLVGVRAGLLLGGWGRLTTSAAALRGPRTVSFCPRIPVCSANK